MGSYQPGACLNRNIRMLGSTGLIIVFSRHIITVWTLLCPNTFYLSSILRKQHAFCISKNKDQDQLRCYPTADHGFCFHYILVHVDTCSTIPLLPKPLAIFCGCTACTWSETKETCFIVAQLILFNHSCVGKQLQFPANQIKEGFGNYSFGDYSRNSSTVAVIC